MKVCEVCQEEKIPGKFPMSRNTPDGLSPMCKQCRDKTRTGGERALRAAQQNRHYYRKKKAIHDLLGGKCVCKGCAHCGEHPDVPCGSKEDLEVDHGGEGGEGWRDKNFEVLQRQLSLRHANVRKELAAAQLLCSKCHAQKTIRDRAEQRADPEFLKKRNEESGWLKHERQKRGRS